MIKKLLFLLFGWPLFCFAQGESRAINYTASSVSFEIRNAGINVDGTFKEFNARIVFDPENLSATQIEGRIKTQSINTGIKGRDNHLKKEEFFYVATYPEMIFRSTGIKKNSSGNYTLSGKLTIRNITKQVSLPMSVERSGKEEVFLAQLNINRLDFQVGEKSWIMSDEVRIRVKVVCQ